MLDDFQDTCTNSRSEKGKHALPSKSADHLFDMTTCRDNTDEDRLENQIEENLSRYISHKKFWTSSKMRLADATTQIRCREVNEPIASRAADISSWRTMTSSGTNYLHRAYEQISDLERANNGNIASNHSCANIFDSASQPRPDEGWLHRVASAMKMSKSTSSSFTCTNLSADSQTQRKHTPALASAVSSNNATTVHNYRSHRLSVFLSIYQQPCRGRASCSIKYRMQIFHVVLIVSNKKNIFAARNA